MYSRAYFFDESSSQHARVCIEANRTIRKRIVYRIVVAANWLYLQLAACNLLDRIQCVLMQDCLQPGIVSDEIFCHIPIFLFM